ncbi:hypothetical protein [Bacillus sp. T3]|uniref:hypothetical protein n=1 Tax=Bacillus sp. T3 TaxID=467262 RepID=UPI002980CFBF|nr:hypothetical protein [Bacillus sp. T3]
MHPSFRYGMMVILIFVFTCDGNAFIFNHFYQNSNEDKGKYIRMFSSLKYS